MIWDAAGLLAYANPAAAAILGALGLSAPSTTQISLLHAAGEHRRVHVRTVPAHDPRGGAAWALSSLSDQSGPRQTEEALAQAREALAQEHRLLQTLLDNMPDFIYIKDRASRFLHTNRSHAAYFDMHDPTACIGKTDFDFYEHTLAQAFFAAEQHIMETGQPLVAAVEDQSAHARRPCWLLSTKVPILQDGQVTGLVGISRDITELRLTQEQLAHQALHDSLTGLPNRVLLHDRLEQALSVAQRDGACLALCLLDLDRFKDVNDTLGHHCGDLLLREVATRLRQALRDVDTIARLGGDEFAILLPGATSEGAIATATRIRDALAEPLEIKGYRPDVAGSIGIALFPLHGGDAPTLLAHADVAMYAAKGAGGGYALYDVSLDEHSPEHLALPREFRQALATGGLFLHYQPLVDLAEGCVSTVEALLRWSHPRHGLIPPARILPLAERLGLLMPLTYWVLDAALRQCQAWQQAGRPLRVAVNISARALQDPALLARVTATLREHAVPPASLTVEITEDALRCDPAQALTVLSQLSQIGVRLAIDDFGTGFSSLAYLKRLPVHEIKIDKSFVVGLEAGTRDEAIVRSMIDLGHSLGLTVVAEGIEDEPTLRQVAALRCDSGQGYFMSQPLPAAALERWVQDSAWGP